MSALHASLDFMHVLAGEAVKLVRTRAKTAASGCYSLAMALGQLCAQLELDPDHMKDCIDIAYKEERKRSAKKAQDFNS